MRDGARRSEGVDDAGLQWVRGTPGRRGEKIGGFEVLYGVGGMVGWLRVWGQAGR